VREKRRAFALASARKSATRRLRAGSEEEHRLFERDPFIYFYEDYLKAYDPAMRKGRGVYYTPPPIVNFIVRSVDDLLKDTFGIADGLADHKRVTVLDFACGTGTFLLEVFERIFENIGGHESGRADHIVREHMLANVYGFEYLIAPYTIAHLKLSQYLRDKGHTVNDNSRLQVFLTNTLEPVAPQKNLLMPALAEEVQAAQEVKDKPILVILGNPPYSGHSKNYGAWIKKGIDGYMGEKGNKGNFVPYRDSKLTRVLKDSLTDPKCHILLIVTLNPSLD
jgi:predicted helicase